MQQALGCGRGVAAPEVRVSCMEANTIRLSVCPDTVGQSEAELKTIMLLGDDSGLSDKHWMKIELWLQQRYGLPIWKRVTPTTYLFAPMFLERWRLY